MMEHDMFNPKPQTRNGDDHFLIYFDMSNQNIWLQRISLITPWQINLKLKRILFLLCADVLLLDIPLI